MRVVRPVALPGWTGAAERLSTGGGSSVLVVGELDREPDAGRMRLIGSAGAGPLIEGVGPACLVGTGADDIILDVAEGRIRTWDARTAKPLTDRPIASAIQRPMAVATGTVRGEVTAFVYGELSPHSNGWAAYSPRTGLPLAGYGDDHYAYFVWEARITAGCGTIATTTQRTVVDEDGDRQEPWVALHSLADGSRYGALPLACPDGFATAVIDGRAVIGTEYGWIHRLSDLAPMVRLAGAGSVLALGLLAGRAVALAEVHPGPELALWILDSPERPAAIVERTWPDPLYAAACTPAGDLILGTDGGVFTLGLSSIVAAPA